MPHVEEQVLRGRESWAGVWMLTPRVPPLPNHAFSMVRTYSMAIDRLDALEPALENHRERS